MPAGRIEHACRVCIALVADQEGGVFARHPRCVVTERQCPAKHAFGRVRMAAACQACAIGGQQKRVSHRAAPIGFSEKRLRVVVAPLPEEIARELRLRLQRIASWIGRQRAPQRLGFLQAARFLLCERQTCAQLRMAGHARERGAEMLYGLREVAAVAGALAERVVRLGVPRRECQHATPR